MTPVFQVVRKVALFILLLPVIPVLAQKYTQTVKGTIRDQAIQAPLTGATVVIIGIEPQKGAITDSEGRFRIPEVPVGQYAVKVNYLGYSERKLQNVTVNSGKEVELTIDLEEQIIQGVEVVVKANVNKEKPVNELAAVSARTFSVDETRRFAAAVNDPARMASAFAGVVTPGDGNNTIVIRGNAPNGLLWRMEGVDMPAPNHFSSVGSSGGGISILSAQLLSNSDFLTGAFPAEYGNALSGVFDMRLRNGNSERYEYTFQAGVLGFDAAAEGPMQIGAQKGSFLANYRYSTLSLLSKMGLNIGDAPTDFQDLSFNLVMPAGNAGNFSLFGIGGLSSQKNTGKADSLLWKENPDRQYTYDFRANTGVLGLKHTIGWNNTLLKTVFAASKTLNAFEEDEILDTDYSIRRNEANSFGQMRYTLSSVLSHKFNARHFLRAGVYATLLEYDFSQSEWDDDGEFFREQLNVTGSATTLNSFVQWQYRMSRQFTLSAGLHQLYFTLNQTSSTEPRASLRYALDERQSFTFGYGLHGQVQPIGVYFVKFAPSTGQPEQLVNRDLGITQAHHYVLAYDRMFAGNLHLKTELYFQDLRNVPVSTDPGSTFSMLNNYDGIVYERLANKGRGRNYGIELTFEKFLTNGLYFMLSSSVFNSEYQAADQKWRNTQFNSGLVNSLVAGKEWNWNRGRKNRTIGLNIKWTYAGGNRETPIDLEASRQKGETVRDESRAFEGQVPAYFRLDTGVRLKRNYKRLTTVLSIDLQNATNRKNLFGRYYDEDTQTIKEFTQAPLIPVLAYRVEF